MNHERNPPGVLAHFSLSITVALVLVVVAAVVTLLFLRRPDWRTEIVFLAALLGGMSAIYSAYFSGVQLREQIRRDGQVRAYGLLAEYNQLENFAARNFVEKNIEGKELTQRQLYNLVSNSETQVNIDRMLNHYENISIAFQEGYADERILYKALEWSLPWMYERLRPYILETRSVLGDTTIWIELDRLVAAWKEGRQLSTGEPLPKL